MVIPGNLVNLDCPVDSLHEDEGRQETDGTAVNSERDTQHSHVCAVKKKQNKTCQTWLTCKRQVVLSHSYRTYR